MVYAHEDVKLHSQATWLWGLLEFVFFLDSYLEVSLKSFTNKAALKS